MGNVIRGKTAWSNCMELVESAFWRESPFPKQTFILVSQVLFAADWDRQCVVLVACQRLTMDVGHGHGCSQRNFGRKVCYSARRVHQAHYHGRYLDYSVKNSCAPLVSQFHESCEIHAREFRYGLERRQLDYGSRGNEQRPCDRGVFSSVPLFSYTKSQIINKMCISFLFNKCSNYIISIRRVEVCNEICINMLSYNSWNDSIISWLQSLVL